MKIDFKYNVGQEVFFLNKRNEERRLMKSWTFRMMARLMDETEMTRSEALKQAQLVRELLEALGQGEVLFQYERADGQLREAEGTLRHGLSEQFDSYEYKTDSKERYKSDDLNFTYWDLERNAFRTFSAARIRRIVRVVIKNR